MRLYVGLLGGVVGIILYLYLSNAHLRYQLDISEAQRKHDVVKAHIEEIDTSLAERLKTIKDENVTIDVGEYNGTWTDRFGL